MFFKIISPKKYKHVFCGGTIYTLLQYLLLSSEEDISKTFFFFERSFKIPQSIIDKLKERSYVLGFNSKYFNHRFLLWILFHLKFIFIKEKSIQFWGVDHSYIVIRNRPFNLLEDGVLNYYPYFNRNTHKGRFFRLKRKIYGNLLNQDWEYAGIEEQCKIIHLTGLSDIPEPVRRKAIVNSLQSLWDKSSETKRRFILDIYGLNRDILSDITQCDKILLTGPFSEIGLISEEEKVKMIRKILDKIGDKVVIKPHPSEKTKYRDLFPEVSVFDLQIPFQLLSLYGVRFKYAYSFNSTAAYSFPYQIKVANIGKEYVPEKLWQAIENGVGMVPLTNPNITIIDF